MSKADALTPSGITMAEIGALVGDPARANMLSALMSGQSLTASDLAFHAGVAAPTASGHLGKLSEAGLLRMTALGRHRYYRLASPAVARMLEAIHLVAGDQPLPRRRLPSSVDAAMRAARTCYDHLAGRLGVALTEALVAQGLLDLDGQPESEAGVVTESGRRFLVEFGIDLTVLARGRRCFCRICIDLTERRPHVAGALGAALCARCFDLGWIARVKDSRAVAVTAAGAAGFRERFGRDFPAQRAAGIGHAAE
jgi:DNA-binding transcriptional ArsR family regulator